eukprot:CAMPEP_0179007190 /NCGR_PEP_ID=MMETSP0795-20121207/15009_1 /TAXON_ID=88552 /ORGANISM="Amoebophrya sp., Strain Ameob2" /LENGTH=63 /DNA_ID=CAMNT_0020702109 /DNA_START=31 /DNA_END=219 /DNA_ORIENTATION=+
MRRRMMIKATVRGRIRLLRSPRISVAAASFDRTHVSVAVGHKRLVCSSTKPAIGYSGRCSPGT